MSPSPEVLDRPARILIVDDEPYNRQLLEVMLASESYVLETAASGEEALALVALQPPDLILLDVMMPGMDGYQVATRLKSDLATRDILIILLTALDDRNSRMHGLSTGADGYITKPIDLLDLRARVKATLGLRVR
jgi:DNA-binding response OmpR family regulator